MRQLFFSIFLSFWSKIPNHTAWRSQRVQGHMRDKMTQSPPLPTPESLGPSTLLDLFKVSPLQLRCSDDNSSLLRHVFACEQLCPLSSTSLPLSSLALFLSSSTPIFALTLVIGWFLTVSLLLLSHSGASVVAVENGYPCLFFFVITQIKIPMN